jgi:hypothetical protein
LESKKLLFSLVVVVFAPLLSGFLNAFAWDVWVVAVKVLTLGLVLFFGFATRVVVLSEIKRLNPRGVS